MKKLTEIVIKQPEFQELLAQAEGGHCPVAVSGLSGVHRAHIAAAMRQVTGCSVVLLCSDEQEGARLQADLAAFTGEPVRLLAGRVCLLRCHRFPSVGAPPAGLALCHVP